MSARAGGELVRGRLAAAAFACALVGLGCGGGFGGQATRSSADVADEVRQLRSASARHEVEIERLRREVARLGVALEAARTATTAPARPPVAPPRPPAPAVESVDLAPPPAPAPTPVAVEEPGQLDAPDSIPAAAQAIYDQGYTLYHESRFLDAETAFQRFLQGWPSSELADNALFWIGASRLARGELDTALAAFREVRSRYPVGNKVPDALLKIAEISERQGDREGALATYRELQRSYPDSAAATAARERTSG